jgi:hypothetical protein
MSITFHQLENLLAWAKVISASGEVVKLWMNGNWRRCGFEETLVVRGFRLRESLLA